MSDTKTASGTGTDRPPTGGDRRAVFALLPLALLGIVIGAFLFLDPLSGMREGVPPVEELSFTRVTLDTEPRQITVTVRNGGPDPVTIAQVLVDDAYWSHEITPDRTVGRLRSATITIPYPWVDEEAHEIVLLSETGVTFAHEIEVALESPRTTAATLGTLALIGIFVGVIPVLIGLLWFPFVRRLSPVWVNFFLALTAGLLVFLAVDATDEAFALTAEVPGAFGGIGLIALGIFGALTALLIVDGRLRRRHGTMPPYAVAALVATGIGLHNLGEGLAIGAAFALAEVGLTTFLILGFTLHNVTEGLGIVAPLARERPKLWHFAALGAIAGVPTIFGTWIGGLAFSPTLAVLFLSIGVGAILQVVWELGRMMRQRGMLSAPLNAAGFATGVVVMYATGLLVAA